MSKRNIHGPVLSTYELRKEYTTPAGDLQVLKGINFSVDPGQMAFIIGRSGCGKSTLMHLLGGLDLPSAGKILFEGEDLTQMNERQRCRIRNLRVGFVFQAYHLIPELTLYENVILPSMIAGRNSHGWAKELLKRVKLLSRKDHFPAELSGGEQQRAAIARALVNRPSVVLCDEPTGNLDAETSEHVYALMTELNRDEGQTFVIVTHDEALAWRHEHVSRLVDGILLREDRGQVGVEKIR